MLERGGPKRWQTDISRALVINVTQSYLNIECWLGARHGLGVGGYSMGKIASILSQGMYVWGWDCLCTCICIRYIHTRTYSPHLFSGPESLTWSPQSGFWSVSEDCTEDIHRLSSKCFGDSLLSAKSRYPATPPQGTLQPHHIARGVKTALDFRRVSSLPPKPVLTLLRLLGLLPPPHPWHACWAVYCF